MVRSCHEHVQYVGSDKIECVLNGIRSTAQCSGCKDFRLRPQSTRVPTAIAAPVYHVTESICRHLGAKLSVAPCCGQMYSCRLHKGKKCAPVGIAKDPFLSCSTCPDFDRLKLWSDLDSSDERPRVGFLSTAYMEFGGTETFHRTLVPRLQNIANVIGFVATGHSGGNGSLLGVRYATGIEAARDLAEASDVLVVWGIDDLKSLLSTDRPKVIAVHHADLSSDWSQKTILRQLDMIDSIVCVNPDVARHLKRHRKPVHYIPNSVDTERIRPSGNQSELRSRHGIPDGSRIVLFGHRMSIEKRPCFAVEVARRLPDGWMMVIAGDGSEKRNVDLAASSCSKVRIVGQCDSLADWLSISDCFLSLSTFEGFGLSIAEAMLAGVPTVSTPTGIAPGLAITLPVESTADQWAAAIVDSHNWTMPLDIGERFSIKRMVDSWAGAISKISNVHHTSDTSIHQI